MLRLSFSEHDASSTSSSHENRPAIRLANADKWDSVPMWPQQGDIDQLAPTSGSTPSSLFSLQPVSEKFGGVVLQLQGKDSQLRDGTLHLPSNVVLVVDGTCGDVDFSNLTFSGALHFPSLFLQIVVDVEAFV